MRDGSGTRDRIERAAMALFVEQGVRETTIRDIATRAQVSEGALYRHHAGKDELVWHLFSTHYVALAERLRAAAGIAAMIEVFCRLHDDDPVLFGFLLLVQHGQLAKVTPDMPSPVQVVHDAIAAQTAGDADLLTAMVMGIVLQTATFKLYGRIAQPMTALAPKLATACMAVLTTR